jgi:hypothetical protein
MSSSISWKTKEYSVTILTPDNLFKDLAASYVILELSSGRYLRARLEESSTWTNTLSGLIGVICKNIASKIAHQVILVAFQNSHATSAFSELPKG